MHILDAVEFEYDEAKRSRSLRIHGIDFAEAAETFDDRHAFIQFDGKHSRNEERFLLVGRSYQGRLLMTVLTVRASLVRIISSRRASRREARGYEERV